MAPRVERGTMAWTTPETLRDRLVVHRDPAPQRAATFAEDVRAGLGRRPMAMSPMWFYDDLGSALFEAICRLPEYYLTRVERDLIATYRGEIVASLEGPLELLELGSGSATKTKLLIEAVLDRQPSLTFHPIDISSEALVESSQTLVAAHPSLRVVAYAGDYFSLLAGRRVRTGSPTLALVLGSNIGNFAPERAQELLRLLAGALRRGDALLIGYDLRKDPSILELAYDDPTGVTAAFNKNLLARMNRELGATFDLGAWRFRARYDDARGAVDSNLVALAGQRVAIPGAGLDLDIAAGDAIHTESSYKFSRDEIVTLAQHCGYRESASYTDAAVRYALSLFVVV